MPYHVLPVFLIIIHVILVGRYFLATRAPKFHHRDALMFQLVSSALFRFALLVYAAGVNRLHRPQYARRQIDCISANMAFY